MHRNRVLKSHPLPSTAAAIACCGLLLLVLSSSILTTPSTKSMRRHNVFVNAAFTNARHMMFKRTTKATVTTSHRFFTAPTPPLDQDSRQRRVVVYDTTPSTSSSSPSSSTQSPPQQQQQPYMKINLHTIPPTELRQLITNWGYPSYRAEQILSWIRNHGVTSFDEMSNLPKSLRKNLKDVTTIGSLHLDTELVSKDGTKKRVYRLSDGQLIESVLMPYDDGRNTACISSQAGCAMACAFCATGQMGFARQLTSDEIFEQVSRFASELRHDNRRRLSNVVMMGMGEPLANYRNVMDAIRRMNVELGIGARKITISTVGVVPNIRKLSQEHIQVGLALSLHCATDEERSALLPANDRYGGLDELMCSIREYIDVTKRRVTFEWALIEHQNDTPETARKLGTLLKRHGIRNDMAHVNVIPLNPTGGFGGSPSGRKRVNEFVRVLEDEFGISATPRVRRGIDIEAGCGQLKAKVKRREEREKRLRGVVPAGTAESDLETAKGELDSFIVEAASSSSAAGQSVPIVVGVYEDDDDPPNDDDSNAHPVTTTIVEDRVQQQRPNRDGDKKKVDFVIDDSAVNLSEEDFSSSSKNDFFVDPKFDTDEHKKEAQRLINLVQASFPPPPPPEATTTTATETKQKTTTSITDENAMREARKRRKKLLKNLRMIKKLRDMEKKEGGRALNDEQRAKVAKEREWKTELESVEHNLK